MSEVNQKRCAPAGTSETFLYPDEVICDDEKKKPAIKISDRKWHISVSGGVGFTAEHMNVEGPGGLVRNERRDPTSSQGFGIATVTVNRRHILNPYKDSDNTTFIAPRLTFSYSRLHAHSDPDAGSDLEKVDVHGNRYMALAGLAFGFDTYSVGGLNVFAEVGPEVIPSYTVGTPLHSWTTFRTGFEMMTPDFKYDFENERDPLLWSFGIEMGGIHALNPATRDKQWGLQVLGGLHFRF